MTPALRQILFGRPQSSTTLNPSDKSASIDLSGGNLSAAKNAGSGWVSARSIASASSGLFYVEVTNINAGVATAVGVCNAAMTLADLVGNTADGVGWPSNDSAVYNNGSIAFNGTSTWNTAGVGIDVALNVTARKVWMRNRGGLWNNGVIGSQNPAGNVGGYTLGGTLATGALFIAVSTYGAGAPDKITVNFGPTFIDLPPSGYGNLS